MDIVLKNTRAYLKGFADNELIKYFLDSYVKSRPRGSGINAKVESSGEGGESLKAKAEGDSINLYGNAYLKYVDEGTGKFNPNISALKRWITEKPVNLDGVKGNTLESKVNTLAFLIGRSISDKGIAPANFIGEVVERALKEIKDSIGEPLKSDIMEDLDTFMISIGYIKKGNTYKLKR